MKRSKICEKVLFLANILKIFLGEYKKIIKQASFQDESEKIFGVGKDLGEYKNFQIFLLSV